MADDLAPQTVVQLENVHRTFGQTPALNGVSLAVQRGEILGIIGRSGAGKSTLIRCLNGLERPDSGTVRIEGQEITRLSETELQPVRRRIGMIFQHFNLLSAKTVEDNVALPLKIGGRPLAERRARVAELLDLVGLADKAKNYPAELSGGQKQRVGIARALAAKPALLLSDEATSALDPETTQQILGLLKDINRQLGLTIVLITHEMEVVRRIADRVIVLDRGRIVEEGRVWEVFARPRTETTQSLLRLLRPQLPEYLRAALDPVTGDETIIQVEVSGEAARQPLLAQLQAEIGLPVRLVHGGIEHVQDQPVGTLFLGLTRADGPSAQRAIEFLSSRVTSAKVLGHVPRNV